MNVERLTRLVEHLESIPDDKFSMLGGNVSPWQVTDARGLKSGIAGHCVALFKEDARRTVKSKPWCGKSMSMLAGAVLEMPQADIAELFLGVGCPKAVKDVTRMEAAGTLRRYVESGRVEWSPLAKPEE